MKAAPLLFIMLVSLTAFQPIFVATHARMAGLTVQIRIDAPIPGYRCYRGCSFTVEAMIRNGFRDPVNISIQPSFRQFRVLGTNYTAMTLEPGAQRVFQWILIVPRNIGFGNHSLSFNITYTVNSTVRSMYREAWIDVIPRNITLLTAELQRNATKYYLLIKNPVRDPGQYIVDNVTVSIKAYNVSIAPRRILVEKLRADQAYIVPLTVRFTSSDIGAIAVNISAHDDIHGLVHFNYTFILVNATAYLDIRIINDYGEPLPGAIVKIANRTYSTDSNGHISLVLPVGIHNYTVEYRGHKVSGRIALYTGFNRYTIVVDLTPPTILGVKREGYGILVKAYDPGSNCSGISLIVFVQEGHVWRYVLYPQRNVSLLLQPSLGKGLVKIIVADDQNNTVCTSLNYALPSGFLISAKEVILVIATVTIVLMLLIIISREGI